MNYDVGNLAKLFFEGDSASTLLDLGRFFLFVFWINVVHVFFVCTICYLIAVINSVEAQFLTASLAVQVWLCWVDNSSGIYGSVTLVLVYAATVYNFLSFDSILRFCFFYCYLSQILDMSQGIQ